MLCCEREARKEVACVHSERLSQLTPQSVGKISKPGSRVERVLPVLFHFVYILDNTYPELLLRTATPQGSPHEYISSPWKTCCWQFEVDRSTAAYELVYEGGIQPIRSQSQI
jgi:hypothetical protein